jgi:hypothetical protein
MPFTNDSKEIYKTLYAYTKGLPRDKVKVCDEVLRDLLVKLRDLLVKNRKQATVAEVEQIAKELNLRLCAATTAS